MKLFKFTFISMTVSCTVDLYAEKKKLATRCFKAIQKNTLSLEKKYNFYNPNSYLSQKINGREKNMIDLDNQTYNILKKVRKLSEDTKGLFDITVGTLKSCYQLNSLADVYLCLEKKRFYTGLDAWALKNKKLQFRDKQTLLDLGGVIKEQAVDEAVKIAKKHQIVTALINYGGDLYGYGYNVNEKLYIGVKNPKNIEESLLTLPLKNQAMTTSASYKSNKKIENKSFSHIIGEKLTLSDIISATVISDSTLTSGVYSTSFMLDTNIEIPENISVVLIDKDMRIHQNILEE